MTISTVPEVMMSVFYPLKQLKHCPKTAPKLLFLLQGLSVHAQRGTGVVWKLSKHIKKQTEEMLFFWDLKNFTSRACFL